MAKSVMNCNCGPACASATCDVYIVQRKELVHMIHITQVFVLVFSRLLSVCFMTYFLGPMSTIQSGVS